MRSNVCNSFRQFFPSAFAAFIHFFEVFKSRLTSPLALVQSGVTLRCLKPCALANFANSSPLNGGPMSDFNTQGVPKVANSLSSLGITVLADIDDTGSTNGKR